MLLLQSSVAVGLAGAGILLQLALMFSGTPENTGLVLSSIFIV